MVIFVLFTFVPATPRSMSCKSSRFCVCKVGQDHSHLHCAKACCNQHNACHAFRYLWRLKRIIGTGRNCQDAIPYINGPTVTRSPPAGDLGDTHATPSFVLDHHSNTYDCCFGYRLSRQRTLRKLY